MDMTASIIPKSDQLDAVDLLTGPRTFTIERVSRHTAEQPFNFHLEGFPRVWRPGLSMRRVITAAWGIETEVYTGRRVTLFCDMSVMFGGVAVGGTRISHMSGIDKPLKVPALAGRKGAIFTVLPLAEVKARDWLHELDLAGDDIDALAALGQAASTAHAPEVAAIAARYNELKGTP